MAMGVFDGILGGVVGATMVSVLDNLIEQHGGVQGIVNQFEKQGFGDTIKSWVGTGENLPISADELHQVLGSPQLQALAAKVGLSVPELTQKLAQALPHAIDKVTPNGVVTPQA
jgi:uncharacterized protein YidB (DUF937 family)